MMLFIFIKIISSMLTCYGHGAFKVGRCLIIVVCFCW